ncbi:MAG: asparagine synthase (glutamine-hydrolyzing), partial [Clostridiales bacterium]|nr:asparagine synthase (glutamine-hydrolyzing) [Clostridiales bacterium]
MCGIAGFCHYSQDLVPYDSVCADMISALKRRGPDSDGVYHADHVRMAHTRLAVVDLENGKQPMIFGNGEREKAIVYNGELYNTEEIRKELRAKGYTFKSHSDTEAVLTAFAAWGPECVKKFNGIFAFAVWDRETDRLFAARDRMGVKPFFFLEKDGGFIFGSEIKALLKHPAVKPILDGVSLAEILLLGPGRTPGCGVFKGIQELLPGHYGFWDRNGFNRYPYWALTAREHTDSFEETVEKIKYLLTDSIQRQTVSDVPLASFLSGGLDSSAIAALSGVRQTFSVDYAENEKYFQAGPFQPDSDDRYIRLMNEHLDVPHETVVLETDDLVESLFEATEARDLPGMADVDGSLLLFCKKVKERATVALSGECADEIFGGYPWYRDKRIREADGFPWSQSTAYRASFLKAGILDLDAAGYVTQKYQQTIALANAATPLDKNFSEKNSEESLENRMKEMFRLNLDWFMQTLLDRKDRMSMWSGLEVRVPFCDHRIVEYLYSVPWEYKNHLDR